MAYWQNITSQKKRDLKVWVKFCLYCLVWIVGNLVTVSILQNGSIWDGLEHWKCNLDKRFEGVEECYICFSVVHSSNLEIPRQSCSKCKKKFHSTCLVSREYILIPNWCHPYFSVNLSFHKYILSASSHQLQTGVTVMALGTEEEVEGSVTYLCTSSFFFRSSG